MRKALLIIAAILFIRAASFGQNEPPFETDTTKPQLIPKEKVMLRKAFSSGDTALINKALNVLTGELDSNGFVIFTIYEKTLLLYWKGNYDWLLSQINRLKKEKYNDPIRQHYLLYYSFPTAENTYHSKKLMPVMITATAQNLDLVLGKISATSLPEDQKQILSLYLKHQLRYWNAKTIPQDTLDHDAEIFLKAYPDSEFKEYIRRDVIRFPKHPNFGAGFYAFPLGLNIYSRSLADYFKPAYGFGFNTDFYYKRLVTSLSVGLYVGRSKTDILIPGDTIIWKSGTISGPFLVDGSVGYILLYKPRMNITPFAGMAYTEYDSPLDDLKLNSYTYTCGTSVDIKFKHRDLNKFSRWYIRLRYTCYLPQFEKKYDHYGGVIHIITVGSGMVREPVPKKIFWAY